jgi:hypothetical protein
MRLLKVININPVNIEPGDFLGGPPRGGRGVNTPIRAGPPSPFVIVAVDRE